MKVKQVVSEHKKGFRAKKYTKKAQHAIEPVKPKKPVGPGEEVNEAVKVTAVDASTGNVTYKDDVTGVETTVPKGMATPSAQGQVQISAQQVAPGEAGAQQAPTIKVGDQVDVVGQTGQTQTMGSMEEDGEEQSSKAALLMKLAKVVKSVQTPEQYVAAKKYARMMHDKLISPHYGSFLPKDMKAMDDIFNSIESDLATKRRELGLARPHRDNFEMDEVQSAVYPSRNPGTPAAAQAAQVQQQPAKPIQSAVYPSRNKVQEADNTLLDQMRVIAGLK